MLPVPYDRPLTQIYTYPQNNPPVVPAIQVHPDGAQLLVTAASLCANAIGDAASSSTTRMFCYNLMSRDNWNNQDFYNMVRLVVDYTVYKNLTQTSGGNVYVTLQQNATEFASLYASYLAYAYQEYLVMLDPPTQQRVMQNVAHFNDYNAKADSVYSMQAQPQMHMPQQHMPQSMVMNRQPGRVGLPQGGHMHYPSHPVQNMHRTAVAHPAAAAAMPVSGHNQTRDSFINTKFTSVPRPLKKEVPTPTQHSTFQGDNMDRNLHKIAYRGTTVAVAPRIQKQTPIQKKVEQNMAPVVPVSAKVGETKEVTSIQEVNFDSAIQSIEANASTRVKLGQADIFPYVVTLLNPIISSAPTDEGLFNSLRECRNLATLSATLKMYRQRIEKEESESARYFGMVWLKKVDKFISDYVNEYFLNAMPQDGFRISAGIMEDGGDIQDFVSSTYKTEANPAFNLYQRNFLTTLFSQDAHKESALPDLEEEPTRAFDYEILTTKQFIAVIAATAEELDFDISRMRGTVIRDVQPTLFEILFNLNKLAKTATATKTMILTLDGKRWVFWEHATDSNVFRIYEE